MINECNDSDEIQKLFKARGIRANYIAYLIQGNGRRCRYKK